MDAGWLRRETGRLCLSFHGLTRVLAVAVQGFQECFDVLVFPEIDLPPFPCSSYHWKKFEPGPFNSLIHENNSNLIPDYPSYLNY